MHKITDTPLRIHRLSPATDQPARDPREPYRGPAAHAFRAVSDPREQRVLGRLHLAEDEQTKEKSLMAPVRHSDGAENQPPELGAPATSSAPVTKCKAEEWHRDGRGLWAMRSCISATAHAGAPHIFTAWRYDVLIAPELLASVKELYDILLNGMQADYDYMTAALGHARELIAKAEARR